MLRKKFSIIVFLIAFCVICGIGTARAEQVTEDWIRSEGSYDTTIYYHWNNIGSVIVKTDSQNNVYVTGTSSDYYRAYKTIKYDKNGNKLWERKAKGAANQQCYPEDMAIDKAGNIHITGGCSGARYYDVYTVKYDGNGTLLWTAAYDAGENRFDLGRALALDADGNVYVGGSSFKDGFRSDYVVIKYNPAGSQAWVARYHGGTYLESGIWPVPSGDYLNALAVDGAGNVYAAGVIKISPANYPTTEYAVVKFDSAGNQLWVRTYPAPGQMDGEAQLVVDAEGNAYMLGGSGILLKYDAQGNALWDMRIPNAYYPTGNLALGKSGNLYVAVTETLCGGTRPYDCADYKTLKIAPNGAVLWTAIFDSAKASDVAGTLVLDDDENVYVTGYKNFLVNYSTVKYDTNGTKLWDIQSPAGDYATSIAVDGQRNVYVSGGTFGSNIYNFQMTTVKYVQPEFNKAPVAGAGPDQTLECAGPEGAATVLDGSNSSDANGDSLSYTWSWTGGTASGANPAVTLPLGTTTVTLTVDDGKGGTATDTVAVTVRDTAPPAAVVRSIAGIAGDNGWYRSDVTVTVDAVDACSGVREISINADGAATTTAGGTASAAVRGDGVHSVSFAATDNAGNAAQPVSLAVAIDKTAPMISAAVSPLANAAGWHNTDVTVTFTCGDSVSGTASCTAPVTVSADGAGQAISGTALDKAGNSASASVLLNIDKAGPVITIAGVRNGATYELGFVPTADYGVTDALSGVAASSAALSGGDGLGLGTFTYSVTAADNAGNGSSASATYQVIATPTGMTALLNSLVASGQVDPVIANSLLAKLNGVFHAANPAAADGKLQAFINEVSAQAGKKITREAAAILINAARYIMNNN